MAESVSHFLARARALHPFASIAHACRDNYPRGNSDVVTTLKRLVDSGDVLRVTVKGVDYYGASSRFAREWMKEADED